MSTSVKVNKEAEEFMLTFVAQTILSDRDGNRFPTEYACRPCFAKLRKGSIHYRNTILLAAARTGGNIEVELFDNFLC